MKRITIVLTDEEYADLERRALQDRRTPRDLAAYLVTRPYTLQIAPYVQPAFPRQWWQSPVIVTSEDTGTDITVVPNEWRLA